LVKQGVDIAETTPAQADDMVRAEWQRWGDITKAAAISAD
jgi:hypothetical protein